MNVFCYCCSNKMDTELVVEQHHLQEECAICQLPYQLGEEIVYLSCTHHFHSDCILPWLLQGPATCPFCRADQREFSGLARSGVSVVPRSFRAINDIVIWGSHSGEERRTLYESFGLN